MNAQNSPISLKNKTTSITTTEYWSEYYKNTWDNLRSSDDERKHELFRIELELFHEALISRWFGKKYKKLSQENQAKLRAIQNDIRNILEELEKSIVIELRDEFDESKLTGDLRSIFYSEKQYYRLWKRIARTSTLKEVQLFRDQLYQFLVAVKRRWMKGLYPRLSDISKARLDMVIKRLNQLHDSAFELYLKMVRTSHIREEIKAMTEPQGEDDEQQWDYSKWNASPQTHSDDLIDSVKDLPEPF